MGNEVIASETSFDDLRSHYVNLCGSCAVVVGITKVGYTVKSAYVQWFISTTPSIPYICEKCSFFICDECRTEESRCPQPCNGNYTKYKIF